MKSTLRGNLEGSRLPVLSGVRGLGGFRTFVIVEGLLRGSWVDMSRVTGTITHIRGLITPIYKNTHEPPSRV